jgi:anthranilate phosphoribosyltransferase
VNTSPSGGFSEILAVLIDRRDLTDCQVRGALTEIAAGSWTEAEIAAVLVAWRMKGETANEIAAAASVVRAHMVRLPTNRQDVLDTCGTGGGSVPTVNISTVVALVVAGAGVGVVKHGNRAVTSRSGSADVLAALGIPLDMDVQQCRRCLEQAGLAFCYAPHFHPSWHRVAAVRRRLGFRTLFNYLGPLANPAGAEFQLLGVGDSYMLETMAEALARLGTRHTLVVWGHDGLDEVSLGERTSVREIRGNAVVRWEWTAEDFGLDPCDSSELQVADAMESATRIREILDGKKGPASRVALANAAAALLAADRVGELKEGVRLAQASIESGRARAILERLVALAEENPAESTVVAAAPAADCSK